MHPTVQYRVKTKKRNPLIIPFIISIGIILFQYSDDGMYMKAMLLFIDPAEEALYANTPQDELIRTFESELHEPINLRVGAPDTHGFRHILSRHTSNYFHEYANKSRNRFDEELTGNDIIWGIEDFFQDCIRSELFNTRNEEKMVYVGYANLRGVPTRSLLVVDTQTRNIRTFYPFTEEMDMLLQQRRQRVWFD